VLVKEEQMRREEVNRQRLAERAAFRKLATRSRRSRLSRMGASASWNWKRA